ncbi:hypothetical protein SMACR_08397 [Sordaria macrospora]|uniref:WGS project CABT00000000 data, contig 2.57 n=2 Tax=Sordaria macrospora TaxID=5147 RepID=F7WA18_SORMK|nr:uncharacterized protein SMAC_08397 [Sordaria macrospora k-hell]KAA8624057.1 hypothetical protein SMACR_08397 [Sordaria macrospora]KAH7625483.1 hypothetical protein B0T09DRAFT_369376 [Sordaria sp. MPI-SDFR-AT-0083]WPJ62548.1 hypothetical protein SMAC4_08397 [Sordaria macrospora]CCC14086.1 unnamed protein product [Sordaria macrospora k-hell]
MASSAPLTTEQAEAAGLLPASHWQQQADALEEEDTVDDGASSIGSIASTTASLSSTIYDYRTVHKRTYHGDVGNAESWEPNDQRHVEALEIYHHAMLVQLDGKLYLSPLDKKKVYKVLDIATGNGMWAIDFADEFPNAEVMGTDVFPIQPSWIPPNVKVCKPGGYVESCGSGMTWLSDDGTATEAMDQWGKVFREGGRKLGRTFTVYEEDLQRKGMEAAGFVDIEFVGIQCPMGVWHPEKKAAERGLWYKLVAEADIEVGYLNYVFTLVMG